jgi:hypothetical protein
MAASLRAEQRKGCVVDALTRKNVGELLVTLE